MEIDAVDERIGGAVAYLLPSLPLPFENSHIFVLLPTNISVCVCLNHHGPWSTIV